MRKRRYQAFLQKTLGIILAVIGISIIVKLIPYYLWLLLLALFLIWLGWRVYAPTNY